jgi:hypothetical protein
MEGRLLQDWLTINAIGDVKVVQGQPFWLDVSGYRDAIVWLDVREVDAPTPPPTANVQITYETAPTEDEALFTQLTSPVPMVNNTVTVTQLLGSLQGTPLARFFRWKLSLSVSNPNGWDVCFRVLVALNRPGYRTPTYMTRPIEGTDKGLSPGPFKPFGKTNYGQSPMPLTPGPETTIYTINK